MNSPLCTAVMTKRMTSRSPALMTSSSALDIGHAGERRHHVGLEVLQRGHEAGRPAGQPRRSSPCTRPCRRPRRAAPRAAPPRRPHAGPLAHLAPLDGAVGAFGPTSVPPVDLQRALACSHAHILNRLPSSRQSHKPGVSPPSRLRPPRPPPTRGRWRIWPHWTGPLAHLAPRQYRRSAELDGEAPQAASMRWGTWCADPLECGEVPA